MSEETETPEDLTVELRRLRHGCRQLLALERDDPAFDHKLEAIKETVRNALGRVNDLRRSGNVNLKRVRDIALIARKTKTEERHQRMLAEIDAIQAERPGEFLSSYRLAELMNARGNVKPERSVDWSSESVRWALKKAGRT